uniref:Uncharacterized protein n=1 Tax=Opuntia streptacantha TaxID=393608 RepID=A0A7C9DUZ4_OPUST
MTFLFFSLAGACYYPSVSEATFSPASGKPVRTHLVSFFFLILFGESLVEPRFVRIFSSPVCSISTGLKRFDSFNGFALLSDRLSKRVPVGLASPVRFHNTIFSASFRSLNSSSR